MHCHRDHLMFVDTQLEHAKIPVISAPDPQRPIPGQRAIPGLAASAQRRFDRFKAIINDNIRGDGFVDPRRPNPRKPRLGETHDAATIGTSVFGYIGVHDGAKEYQIPDEGFKEIAGGSHEALTLKRELVPLGALVTDKRGEKVSYVVKRPVPGSGRAYVVALRQRAKRR